MAVPGPDNEHGKMGSSRAGLLTSANRSAIGGGNFYFNMDPHFFILLESIDGTRSTKVPAGWDAMEETQVMAA